MPAISCLPGEILYMIFAELDLMSNKGFRLSSVVATHPTLPCLPASGYAFGDLDISIFDALAVSQLWRQIGLNTVFQEDTADWNCERSEIRIHRVGMLRI